jgi:hypothetical protein
MSSTGSKLTLQGISFNNSDLTQLGSSSQATQFNLLASVSLMFLMCGVYELGSPLLNRISVLSTLTIGRKPMPAQNINVKLKTILGD